MENRHSWASPARMPFEPLAVHIDMFQHQFRIRFRGLDSRIPSALRITLVGCGAPGDPVASIAASPNRHHRPLRPPDGRRRALNFSLPSKTIRGERLQQPPAIEILRGEPKPDGSPNLKSFHVVETIPGELAAKYQSDDRTQIITPIPPPENRDSLRFRRGLRRFERVRRVSVRPPIPTSSKIHVYPVPAARRPTAIAKLTESAIDSNLATRHANRRR